MMRLPHARHVTLLARGKHAIIYEHPVTCMWQMQQISTYLAKLLGADACVLMGVPQCTLSQSQVLCCCGRVAA
jgi:hypothetical protein